MTISIGEWDNKVDLKVAAPFKCFSSSPSSILVVLPGKASSIILQSIPSLLRLLSNIIGQRLSYRLPLSSST